MQILFMEILIRTRQTFLQIKIKEIKGKVNETSGKIATITFEEEIITILEIGEEEENLGIIPNHGVKSVENLAIQP